MVKLDQQILKSQCFFLNGSLIKSDNEGFFIDKTTEVSSIKM